jgi:4-hydroxy-tetrahydrodipicolinate synthase
MKTPAELLTGVLPVFQTPYHEDESIDFDTLQREIEWLFERGANGIVMAMVSEILRLSTAERLELARLACEFAGDRGATIIGVGAESIPMAVEYAHHAEGIGATAVMAIPPVSIGVGRDELVRYYRHILAAISIPVIVQDASGYVGRPMPVDTQAALLDEFGPDRILYKPEATPLGPNLSALREATGGRARALEGSGGITLVDSFRRGVVGTMPGADLIDGLVALWKALQSGDDARIYPLSLPVCGLVSLQSGLDGFLAVEKYLLKKQGIFRNTIVRGPVAFKLDEETRQEVDRLFALLMQAVEASHA